MHRLRRRKSDPDADVLADMRTGRITINQARAAVGNGPIEGGDVVYDLAAKMLLSSDDLDQMIIEMKRRWPDDWQKRAPLTLLNNGEWVEGLTSQT